MGGHAGGIGLHGLPARQRDILPRPRVSTLLDDLTTAHRVVIVSAPSGYGKSVAVREWAAGQSHPVAWISLTPFDGDPMQVGQLVVRALQRATSDADDPSALALEALDPQPVPSTAFATTVLTALSELDDRLTLVIDDAHRARDAVNGSLLGDLVTAGPDGLRIILISTEKLGFGTDRLALTGEAARLPAAALAFTPCEIRGVAAMSGLSLSLEDSEVLRQTTGGWPAAIRLLTLSTQGQGPRPLQGLEEEPGERIVDFVDSEVLGRLPSALREFVVAATTTGETTPELAGELSGRHDAASLLDECVDRGLFLDRFRSLTSRPAYRWHPVFAAAVQAGARRRDTARVRASHAVAADVLAGSDPIRASYEALEAGDGERASEILREGWLDLLVARTGANSLDAACAALPLPWADDPEIIMIRACCRDVSGQRAEGQRLLAAAMARTADAGPASHRDRRRTTALAQLFLADERSTLTAAIDHLYSDLSGREAGSDRQRLALLLMLGLAQMRLRIVNTRTLDTLTSAVETATVIGDRTVARRSGAILAIALAFAGDFAGSESVRARMDALTEPDDWHSYIGGAEDAAAGYVAYYQNRLDDAARHFRRVIASGSGPVSFSSIARKYFALTAAASGDNAARREARSGLGGMPEADAHGVPWAAYRLISLAKLAEADGRLDRARGITRRFGNVEHLPAVAVLLAELQRRLGAERESLLTIEQIRPHFRIPYVKASALTTLALIHRTRGRRELAHEVLEEALDTAEPQSVARPFCDPYPDLVALLTEHSAWGSAHQSFIGELSRLTGGRGASLSEREIEILGHLRTSLTTTEIASELGISINTMKTHLRAIYRKLDVASRREAVQSTF